jgi:hypothetical protein
MFVFRGKVQLFYYKCYLDLNKQVLGAFFTELKICQLRICIWYAIFFL